MRYLFGASLLAGVITLAIIVGQRLSTDAMAAMTGVVFGVAASIPTSLLIALAARGGRRHDPPYRRDDYQPSPPAPQIYVVTPGQLPAGSHAHAVSALPQPPGVPIVAEPVRRYRVVGDAEYWLEETEPRGWD